MERDEDVIGLISALDSPRVKGSPRRRSAVLTSLRRIRARGATSTICDLLKNDPDELVRSTAAKALGEIGDPSALPALRSALGDPSDKVLMWTIRSLGQMHDSASIDKLISKLRDSDWGVRAYAATALGEIGDARANEALNKCMSDRKATVRNSAERALIRIGESD